MWRLSTCIGYADQAVVCATDNVDSCTLEVIVEVDDLKNPSLVLLLAEQDGQPTCGTLTQDELQSNGILPHESSWDTKRSKTELTYAIELPAQSYKLCLVLFDSIHSTPSTP